MKKFTDEEILLMQQIANLPLREIDFTKAAFTVTETKITYEYQYPFHQWNRIIESSRHILDLLLKLKNNAERQKRWRQQQKEKANAKKSI